MLNQILSMFWAEIWPSKYAEANLQLPSYGMLQPPGARKEERSWASCWRPMNDSLARAFHQVAAWKQDLSMFTL